MSKPLRPKDIDEWIDFGIELRKQNKFQDSIEAILNGLRMKNRTNKQYGRGFSEMARTFLSMELFNESLTAIKTSIKWDSENGDYKKLQERIINSKKEKEDEISKKFSEIENLIQTFNPKKALEKLEEVNSAYNLKQFKGFLSFVEQNTLKCESYLRAISVLKDEIPLIYEEIPLKELKAKVGLNEITLKEMVIQLIKERVIQARLKGSTLFYIPEDKTIELLEDIKDNTEIIKMYAEKIEDILDKQDNLEEYLRSHLSTDFEKIKEAWEDYKEGYITKKGLIKEAIKVLGKKFIKIFIKS